MGFEHIFKFSFGLVGFSVAIVLYGSSTRNLFRYPVFCAATTSTAITSVMMMMAMIMTMRMSRGGMKRKTVIRNAGEETAEHPKQICETRPDGKGKGDPARRDTEGKNRPGGDGNRPDGNGRRE